MSSPSRFGSARTWLKFAGLAGAVGVAATGAVVARSERQRRQYEPDEIREQLHRRLAVATSSAAPADPEPEVRPTVFRRAAAAVRRTAGR